MLITKTLFINIKVPSLKEIILIGSTVSINYKVGVLISHTQKIAVAKVTLFFFLDLVI